jgi:hypothetical protein
MYKIVGADGKEYGPVSLEQVRQWVAQGRINAQTRVQAVGAEEWKTAGEFPEINALFTAVAPPPMAPLPTATGPRTGLAITSLVLGILSMLCFGVVSAIPAIVCGHLAYSRSRRAPAQYGGGGLAVAGFVTGYAGVFMTFVLVAMLLPALAAAKSKAQSIACVNNLKQVGLACKVWALDHTNEFCFNISTNQGGTLELCKPGADGFDKNAVLHFQVMSNELSSPKILFCPADATKTAALDFRHLQSANVSYQLYTGTNVSDANPTQVLVVCPIHGHELLCDGSVVQKGRTGRRRGQQ